MQRGWLRCECSSASAQSRRGHALAAGSRRRRQRRRSCSPCPHHWCVCSPHELHTYSVLGLEELEAARVTTKQRSDVRGCSLRGMATALLNSVAIIAAGEASRRAGAATAGRLAPAPCRSRITALIHQVSVQAKRLTCDQAIQASIWTFVLLPPPLPPPPGVGALAHLSQALCRLNCHTLSDQAIPLARSGSCTYL